MNPQRRTLYFSGRVQGVGFRMTVVQLSRDLPLAGTVRNLPDGRVELIAEGDAGQIDTLLARLREHFEGHIRTMDQQTTPPEGFPEAAIRILH